MAPPMSCPATRSGTVAPRAWRKRSTQSVSAGTVAVSGVSSPPERPQPGRSTATGCSPAAASGAITGCHTRLQYVPWSSSKSGPSPAVRYDAGTPSTSTVVRERVVVGMGLLVRSVPM